MRFLPVSLSLLATLGAFAAPAEHTLGKRQIQTLSPGAVAVFKPYTFYSSAAYCSPCVLRSWTCGADCTANSGFRPTAAGGDGAAVQYWYVGYDPSLATVIVGHEGTDTERILPLLTDANAVLLPLDPFLFPGVGLDVLAHTGFSTAHKLTASDVLTAVNTTMAKFGTNTITTVGHSLGAAISLLEAVHLKLVFPNSIVKFYGYGLPRVGNQLFANLADNTLNSLYRITNREDPIPTVPNMSLGYKHPSGEDHIEDDLSWKACPGQDNPDAQCIDGAVPIFPAGDLSYHGGPYDGVTMGC